MKDQLSTKGGPAPHYKHNCPGCTFLGSFVHERDGVHDLYFCRGYLVAVRSNDPEFTFGLLASDLIDAWDTMPRRRPYPSLDRAYQLARQKGLV